MMQMDWTTDQKKAIEARKGTLLVSAAAGSGKTAVLVERVIRRICDAENPCGVENLLIVTFTKAAAAQMKEKIHAAIGKKIALNPSDKRLRRQQLMLPCANICTIDSFCIGLVRENFHVLGIAPDFSLLDEGKLAVLRSQAVSSVADSLYKEQNENFMRLTALISDTRDDNKLISAILKLYSLSRAYPFPELWLKSLADEFNNPSEIEESPWGKTIINHAIQFICSCIADAEHCMSLLVDEPELAAKYQPVFEDDLAILNNLLEKLSTESWDKIIEAFESAPFKKMAIPPRKYESPAKDICKNTRSAYRKQAIEFASKYFISSDEHKKDIEYLAPAINELISAVLKFGDEFTRLKREENGADFSDTLHLALKLLVEPVEGGYKKSPLALSLAENYAEILVDEYQDVNEAQDMIFSALSKDENNLFMVGDVKQSIYRFRQAMPEIFLARRDGLSEYEDGNYPARVTLGKNFRSRKGVTDIVNFIFSSVMSRDAGGLDYDEKEHLEAAATYPESEGADTEICLIETKKENFRSAQAKYVADYIEKAMSDGTTFTDGDVQRKAKYKDFCILLRSVKRSAKEFTDEFTARGIPFSCEMEDSFLDSPEIMFLTSLLKIIDNPVDDIPLTAVMLSPVFGFTPDDLAMMRADNKEGSVYHCVVNSADKGNLKAALFLEKIRDMRLVACTVSAGELVRRLIEETGYGAIVGAMKDSSKRRANINSFIDLANRYESTGKKGVSGFLRHLDSVAKSGNDIRSSSSDTGNADCVRIMTIHKSKGLEFPVCFLGATEKPYGNLSTSDDLLISPIGGIGLKTSTDKAKYDSLTRIAAVLEIKKAERSEELRILYVALTRPKERLVILASGKDWNKGLAKIAANIRKEKLIDPFKVIAFPSYADVLLSSLIRHPDAHALRNAAMADSSIVVDCDIPLKTQIIKDDGEESQVIPDIPSIKPDKETVREISDRLGYVYPYSSLGGVVAKRIASKFDAEEIGGEYFASRKPAFVGKDKLTPAQRGTATHRFMQYADYEKAGKSVSDELDRLVRDGMLTEAEASAVDQKPIAEFFSGSLAKRILSAEKVYREYTFAACIPLKEIQPDIPENEAENENVVIQGAVDCAFVENGSLVIVDFKTDRAKSDEELVGKYKDQLGIYCRCLSEVLDIPVKEAVIYSFRLGKSIEMCL